MPTRADSRRRAPSLAVTSAVFTAVGLLGVLTAAAAPTPTGRTLTVDEAWDLTAGGPGDNPYGNGKCCVPYPACQLQPCTGTVNCHYRTHIEPEPGNGNVCGNPASTPTNDDPNCVTEGSHQCSILTRCKYSESRMRCVIGDHEIGGLGSPELCVDNCDF